MRGTISVAGMTAAAVGASLTAVCSVEQPFFCATVLGNKVSMYVAGWTVDALIEGPPDRVARQLADSLNADPVVRRHLHAWAEGDALALERR